MTIRQFITILAARKWIVLVAAGLTVFAVVGVSALLPVRWTATAVVLVDAKGPDPITGALLPAQMIAGYMATQVDILKSRNVALKVVSALKLDEQPTAREEWQRRTAGRGSLQVWLADQLLRGLEVTPTRDSSVIDVSFSGTDPVLSADVANAFAQAYIETTLELKVEPARQSAKWFSERTKALRQAVEASAAKLADYQRAKGIVSVDERLDTESARLEQLNGHLSQAAAMTADAMTRQRLARDYIAAGGTPDAIPAVLTNTLVQSLKTDLSRQEGRLRELSSQLGKNHPQYQAAAAEVQSTQQKLQEEMGRVISSLENTYRIATQVEAEVRTQVAAQKAKVLGLKKERDQLAAFVRDAENAQKAFDLTTQRYAQTSLESQATHTNIAVLSPATEPITPSFPNWLLNIVLGLLLGAILGAGIATLAELLDQRIRSGADAVGALQVPLLAIMPDTEMRHGARWFGVWPRTRASP